MGRKKSTKDTSAKIGNSLSSFFKEKSKINVDDMEVKFFSTGVKYIDAVLGGGIPMRKLSMLIGLPGSGKTTFMYNIMGEFQYHNDGKCIILYVDNEQSSNDVRLMSCGFNPNHPDTEFITVTCTLEEVFKSIDLICQFKDSNDKFKDYPVLMVWDSITNTIPDKLKEVDRPEEATGVQARVISSSLPKYLNGPCKEYDITMVVINQLRDKIDFGVVKQKKDIRYLKGNKRIPGGNSLLFNSHNIIQLEQKSILTQEKDNMSGVEVFFSCSKNRSFCPNIMISTVFNNNVGFSDFWTNYFLQVKTGYINNTGGWVKMNGYTKDGSDEVAKFRRKDAEGLYKIDSDFKAAFDENSKQCVDEFIKENTISIEEIVKMNKNITDEIDPEIDVSKDEE